jgi:hypothetical protein
VNGGNFQFQRRTCGPDIRPVLRSGGFWNRVFVAFYYTLRSKVVISREIDRTGILQSGIVDKLL